MAVTRRLTSRTRSRIRMTVMKKHMKTSVTISQTWTSKTNLRRSKLWI